MVQRIPRSGFSLWDWMHWGHVQTWHACQEFGAGWQKCHQWIGGRRTGCWGCLCRVSFCLQQHPRGICVICRCVFLRGGCSMSQQMHRLGRFPWLTPCFVGTMCLQIWRSCCPWRVSVPGVQTPQGSLDLCLVCVAWTSWMWIQLHAQCWCCCAFWQHQQQWVLHWLAACQSLWDLWAVPSCPWGSQCSTWWLLAACSQWRLQVFPLECWLCWWLDAASSVACGLLGLHRIVRCTFWTCQIFLFCASSVTFHCPKKHPLRHERMPVSTCLCRLLFWAGVLVWQWAECSFSDWANAVRDIPWCTHPNPWWLGLGFCRSPRWWCCHCFRVSGAAAALGAAGLAGSFRDCTALEILDCIWKFAKPVPLFLRLDQDPNLCFWCMSWGCSFQILFHHLWRRI